jgi:hypothetical protein
LSCTATVQIASDCRSDQTGEVSLTLSQAIRASIGETITLYFGDCTTAAAEIKSIEAEGLIYGVSYDTGFGPTDDPEGEGETQLNADMICDRGGIIKVCVPPSTDITCPPCEATLTACVDERDQGPT